METPDYDGLTAGEIVAMCWDKFWRRTDAARNAGGISRHEVENNEKVVPEGWVLDPTIAYYIPPNVILFSRF